MLFTGSEVYEDVERLLKKSSTRRGKVDEQFERNAPARRSVIMDVFSKSGTLHRALWCEMPEVGPAHYTGHLGVR